MLQESTHQYKFLLQANLLCRKKNRGRGTRERESRNAERESERKETQDWSFMTAWAAVCSSLSTREREGKTNKLLQLTPNKLNKPQVSYITSMARGLLIPSLSVSRHNLREKPGGKHPRTMTCYINSMTKRKTPKNQKKKKKKVINNHGMEHP